MLTGIKDKGKKGKGTAKKKKWASWRESIGPSMQTEAAAFKEALGGQVKCPAKGFSPATCGRPKGFDPNLGKRYCYREGLGLNIEEY